MNTTWSYLFEWYGYERYYYVPVWTGKPAQGFPGSMEYGEVRSNLPDTQFIIIEPTLGINEVDKDNFFREENYFTELLEEKYFGTIAVQKRKKI